MKYSNYLEQYIGEMGNLYVHRDSGTYEFEIYRKAILFQTLYMLINVGEDFVVLAKRQYTLEDDANKYDKTVIPLQRFLVSIPKSS